MSTIVLIPDTHVPEQHDQAVKNIGAFLRWLTPDGVVHAGDFLNLDAPSRWSKGSINEFLGGVHREREEGKKVLGFWRDCYSGPFGMHIGNHDRRVSDYVQRYAPAVADMPEWRFDRMLDFDGFGIDLRKSIHPLDKGWVSTHGDNREISLKPTAGATAHGAALRYGVNVACGHTHRAGIVQDSVGYGGRMRPRIGFELGHISDLRKVSYLPTGYANWQMAFGVLVNAKPQLVLMDNDGSFSYGDALFKNGKTTSLKENA